MPAITDSTAEDLNRIGAVEELQVTTRRGDGSLRAWVPIWVVRVGDELYVRSFRGDQGAWYRHATQASAGRVRTGEVERDVMFDADVPDIDAVDAAYRGKYSRFGESYLQPMLTPAARSATLRLTPTTEG